MPGMNQWLEMHDKQQMRKPLQLLACLRSKKSKAAEALGLTVPKFNNMLRFVFGEQTWPRDSPPAPSASPPENSGENVQQQYEAALREAQGAFYRKRVENLPGFEFGSGKQKSEAEYRALFAVVEAVAEPMLWPLPSPCRPVADSVSSTPIWKSELQLNEDEKLPRKEYKYYWRLYFFF